MNKEAEAEIARLICDCDYPNHKMMRAAMQWAYADAAKIARTPFTGEQDDITMEAKDRIAKTIEDRAK